MASAGNSNVKHRRGWSSRNLSSSHRPVPTGTTCASTHMMKRSITGKPVLPMMMKKDMASMTKVARLKDIMLSGVSVKPRSMKAEFAVKNPHQVRVTPADSTTFPQGSVCAGFRIQGSMQARESSQNPQK